MIRVGIPIFRQRVSPVFDSCTRILIINIERGWEVERKEFYLDALALTERMTIFKKFGVNTVICGGISDLFANMILSAKIVLISDISGEIEQVLAAYLAEKLDDSRFLMPGVRVDTRKKAIYVKE